MSFFLRQRWIDPRLQYEEENNITRIELDTRVISQIWVPDLYIVNEKNAEVHDVTVPNKLMHLYPSGMVVYSMRVSGTFSCYMDLMKYPLDSQICNITMESYGLSTNTMVLRWNTPAVTVSPSLELPQFNLSEFHHFVCDAQYAAVNFTCIGFTLHFDRNYGYYMIQVYIPSVLIVMLSWVSFWLNIDATPARISLGLLTVLTMTTQSTGARSELPRVSYIKAIDIWMATCLFFVFAALIEFAYVNVLSRVEQRRLATIKDMAQLIHNGEEPKKSRKFSFWSAESRQRARTVDKISRVLFPCIFILFNVIYWLVYRLWKPVKG
ncbi:hypothetical protein FSP39_006057 [Pinctada imbricata]|uniref:Uncharacterized protein n=1 Tax=Pinctada imbricata TaxID=66713 RepID=A0AA89BYW1_PINIB|nr:hypothetical protein FSP39_006057 [Pinctada imbricata]